MLTLLVLVEFKFPLHLHRVYYSKKKKIYSASTKWYQNEGHLLNILTVSDLTWITQDTTNNSCERNIYKGDPSLISILILEKKEKKGIWKTVCEFDKHFYKLLFRQNMHRILSLTVTWIIQIWFKSFGNKAREGLESCLANKPIRLFI